MVTYYPKLKLYRIGLNLFTSYLSAKAHIDKPKKTPIDIMPLTVCALAAILLCTAFYIGISKDLCTQGLTEAAYASMKLDCSSWLYR